MQIANDTPYGLVNSVLTADLARGMRVARQLRAGMVHVNDATPQDEALAPFGGIGRVRSRRPVRRRRQPRGVHRAALAHRGAGTRALPVLTVRPAGLAIVPGGIAQAGGDMSEAASIPFSETKAPESPERLHRGALGLVDISASTMANIGPAYSFYFGFAFLVITAGVAAPLTIIAAGVAIALLGNTLSQFSRAQPSTGGFISFVGKTFGGTSAVTTALLCGAGYIIAISSVLAVVGGFLSITLQYYFGWNIPWGILSVLLTAGAVVMMVRGVGVSTKLAGLLLRLRDAGARSWCRSSLIIKNGGHLSLGAVRAEPHHQRVHAAWRPASRSPSTCSSAGRTPPRWPRRPATRGATCRARSSCPWP